MSQPEHLLSSHGAVRFDRADRGMALADKLLLVGLTLALVIVDNPFNPNWQDQAPTRHLPLIVSLIAFVLANLGRALHVSGAGPAAFGASNRQRRSVVRAGLPFLLLAVWIVCGSMVARFVNGASDTFLNSGIYMLLTLSTARCVVLSRAPQRLIHGAVVILAISATIMIGVMLVEHELTGGRYHEMEFLVPPIAVYMALSPRIAPRWRTPLTLFFLASGIVFLKNTGFIVMAMTLAYLFIVDWRIALRKHPARLYRVVTAGGLLCATVLAAWFATGPMLVNDVSLPDGNPGYRVRAYEKALARFEASPIVGVSFSQRSTTLFTAFEVAVEGGSNQLPTHSDVLDLLANGGAVAIGLLAWGYLRITRLFLRVQRGPRGLTPRSESGAAAHMFACMSVTALFVYAFNPLMLQPDKGMLIWVCLGLLLGMCVRQPSTENTISGPTR